MWSVENDWDAARVVSGSNTVELRQLDHIVKPNQELIRGFARDDGDSDIVFVVAAITGAGNVDTGMQTRITDVMTDVMDSDDVNPGVGVGPQVSCMVSQAVPNVRVRVCLLANNGIVASAAPHNVAVLAKGQR